jgi:hypothetical protein
MRTSGRNGSRTIALACIASLLCAATAMAQTTEVQKVAGASTGSGKISRTIIDTQPNGPQDGIQSTYTMTCTVPSGLTQSQIATMYRDSLNFYLASGNFKAYLSPSYSTNDVRLTKTVNTPWSFSLQSNTIPGNTTVARPLNVEDAPLASPATLAMLGLALTGMAWWARRRRRLV